jgi:hypothetical protein
VRGAAAATDLHRSEGQDRPCRLLVARWAAAEGPHRRSLDGSVGHTPRVEATTGVAARQQGAAPLSPMKRLVSPRCGRGKAHRQRRQHDLGRQRSCCTGAASAAATLARRHQLPGGYDRQLERVGDACTRSLLLPKAAGGCLTARERKIRTKTACVPITSVPSTLKQRLPQEAIDMSIHE